MTLDIPKLHKEIRDNIDSLNSGGCGWFAYYFCKYARLNGIPCLIEADGIPFRKIDFRDRIESNRRGDERHIAANHFFVNVKGILFDGYNYWTMTWDTSAVQYSLGEMQLALSLQQWNRMYDTEQNTKLEEIIKNFFEKV